MERTRVGINGFGRIGRQALRAALSRRSEDLDVALINDPHDGPVSAYLLKHDSTYGEYPGVVSGTAGALHVDGRNIVRTQEVEPRCIPWSAHGVDVVLECTGAFTAPGAARAHLDGGAGKVIVSAVAADADVTIVIGVNETDYDAARHDVISNASCTTNAAAPVAKVLTERFGVQLACLSTVHAYTNSQGLLDVFADDPRDGRAAGVNIVPAKTGASRALAAVVPALGAIGGLAFRVPVTVVSVIDLVALLRRSEVSAAEVQAALREAAEGDLAGILGYTDEPLVSSDLRGDPRSSVVSGPDIRVIGGRLAQIVAWYDNEWGYACRLVDLAAFVGARLAR
ncbi:MAG: glyceraldehyde 3-phosphate dehydrogenase NAD-binding domain-containing protein, partial [Chloroflexota bacterium]